MTEPRCRVLLVTPNFANNSLGRTYCLWLLAHELGWQTTVVGVRGAQLWEPLRAGPFSLDCHNLTGAPARARTAHLHRLVRAHDVVIAVKPLASSLGLSAPLATEHDKPFIVDIDDPDLEVRSTARPLVRRARPHTTWGRGRELRGLREFLQGRPTLVSNPVLQQTYGGLIVPHVRPAVPQPGQSDSRDIVVRFVGSVRGHKGLDVLRAAVAQHAGRGVRLEVTSDAPANAVAWESWLGQTSFDQGQALVASADVIALPSLPEGYALAQLPAKLIDAMVTGRAVVASDLAPIAWALGGSGLLVPPGNVAALADALARLKDPTQRRLMGQAAYERASRSFTVAAVAPSFGQYVERAATAGRRASTLRKDIRW